MAELPRKVWGKPSDKRRRFYGKRKNGSNEVDSVEEEETLGVVVLEAGVEASGAVRVVVPRMVVAVHPGLAVVLDPGHQHPMALLDNTDPGSHCITQRVSPG